jgi:hypothetical protein
MNMKNIILSIALLFSFVVFGQTKKNSTKIISIPIEVESAFQKQFPNTKADWKTTYMGDDFEKKIFEGECIINGVKATAMYTKEGFFKALQMDIEMNELPAAALTYMKTNFPNDTISEIWKTVDYHKETLYGVVISRKGQFYDYIFDGTGYYLHFVETQSLFHPN